MSLPYVRVTQKLTAAADEKAAPGFEMEINATFRDLQPEALIEIERTLAEGINRMAAFGERQIANNRESAK